MALQDQNQQVKLRFTEAPTQMTCPNCNANIVTQIKRKTGAFTWLTCAGFCLFCGCLGCCLIPFCVDRCKDVEHYCPNCDSLVGVHNLI